MNEKRSTVEAAEPADTQDRRQTPARRARFLNTQTAPWIASMMWVLIVVLMALALFLQYVNNTPEFITQVLFFPAFLSFPTIGALIVSRRPNHPIGWMFLAVGLVIFGVFAQQYA